MAVASLWYAILIGPVAWLVYLEMTYALAANCASRRAGLMLGITVAALIAATGGLVGGRAVSTLDAGPEHDRARARFMALLGLAMSLLFAVAIVAGVIPTVILLPCG
jgi:hypothetical protein